MVIQAVCVLFARKVCSKIVLIIGTTNPHPSSFQNRESSLEILRPYLIFTQKRTHLSPPRSLARVSYPPQPKPTTKYT